MGLIPIVYDLLPAQKRFVHTNPDVMLDVCIYQGGFGSGKTWIGSFLGLLLCQKYPGVLGLVLAKTFPMVRDTTLRTYFEHLEQFGLVKGRDYSYHVTEARLVFHCWGESEILFRHLQEPGKIKSLNAGWIQVEEISQITESDFLMILSRIRQKGIARYRVFGHTNPQARKGWIWKYFVEQNPGKQVITVSDREAVIEYRRVIAPTSENIHLSAHYLENMKQQFDGEYYRINVLGEDGDYSAGRVCKTWSDCNIEKTSYRPELRIYLSCDFNVDPMCWVLAHRYNGEYHFFDEFCLENTTTGEAAEAVALRYREHRAGITVTGDASGNNRSTSAKTASETNYTILRNRLLELGLGSVQLDLRAANPLIADRVAAWNAMVCNSNGVVRVKVDPRCEWLIRNCENLHYVEGTSVIWEPTANDIQRDRHAKFVKHIFDAASYLVERYDPIRLKIPHEQRQRNKIIPFQS